MSKISKKQMKVFKSYIGVPMTMKHWDKNMYFIPKSIDSVIEVFIGTTVYGSEKMEPDMWPLTTLAGDNYWLYYIDLDRELENV